MPSLLNLLKRKNLNLRCGACFRSVLTVRQVDGRCGQEGSRCGLGPLLEEEKHEPEPFVDPKSLVDTVLDMERGRTVEVAAPEVEVEGEEPAAWMLFKYGEKYALKWKKDSRGGIFTWLPLQFIPSVRRK